MGDRALNISIDDSIIKGASVAVAGGGILAALLGIWSFVRMLIGVPKRVTNLESMQVVVLSSLRALTQAALVPQDKCGDAESSRVREDLLASHEELNRHIDRIATGGEKDVKKR